MFKFKKIASVLASAVMFSSTIGLAAAANYPAPFVQGGSADAAIVWGGPTNAPLDSVAVIDIVSSLNGYVTTNTVTTDTTVTGGDYVLLAKSSDNINVNDNWGVFTGSVDDTDLTTLLADGTYRADDNDEFDYEQKINVGSPTLQHFRDSDYETLAGLDSKTPVIGFKLSSNTWVMNYTLDFTTDAESDIVGSDLDDIEGSTLHLMGKDYYVSNLDNSSLTGANAIYHGKLTLLDSAVTSLVSEGETVTKTIGDASYDVSIAWIDSDSVKFTVNGETTDQLAKGESYKLSDGIYVGAKDITKLEVSGEIGSADFSLGSGKLEITSGDDIKLNDDTINGVKGYIHKGTGSGGTEKIDKIVIEWITDEEEFLSPSADLTLPGFNTLKFTMGELVRNEEEEVVLDGGSNDIELTLPIKDGKVTFGLLYNSETTGNITAIGKAADERLATSQTSKLTFYEKNGGSDMDSWFVGTYNISAQAESYLLRASVSRDSSANRNETTIQKNVAGSWVDACTDKAEGNTCDIGLVSFTINDINWTSGGSELITITAGTNTNFHTIYTAGGLKIWLPVNISEDSASSTTAYGRINLSMNGTAQKLVTVPGHDINKWFLFFDEEDKDDNIESGTAFNVTIDDTTSTSNPLQISQVNEAGTGGSASSVAYAGSEVGTSSSNYETYMKSDVATRIVHYTGDDEDDVTVYYPSGDSESYAEVFLTEVGAEITGGGSSSGGGSSNIMSITDSEIASASGKDIIVIGGSCINTVAADLLGSATPMCGADFTTASGVSAGEFLLETFSRTGGGVATLVAGYNAGDTTNGATFLTTQTVDTTTGMKYKGTSGSSAELVTSTA